MKGIFMAIKKNIERTSFSLRLDQFLMNEARKYGIDINELIENKLREALKKKKCPVCGSTISCLTSENNLVK
jgi:post-segregation antitoxin (ccd killing protein)